MEINISKLKDILNKEQQLRDYNDIKLIGSFISNIKFFESIKENKSIFKECCMYLTYEYFDANQYIFKEGEIGNKFYILIQGQAGVIIKEKDKETESITFKEVFVYNDGGSFGELALIDKKPRAASILTKTECHIAVLDKINYSRLLSSIMKKRRNELVDFLQKQAIFQQWTKGSLLKLSYCFEEKSYQKGKIIFAEGQKIEYVYLIKEGEMIISRNLKINLIESDDPLTRKTLFLKKQYKQNANICILGIGELIGVYDINNGFYSGTCKCLGNEAILLAISANDFKKRINNLDSINFLQTGRMIKESIHQNSIKAITICMKERIHSPYKKIFSEEVGMISENKLRQSFIEKLKCSPLNTSIHREKLNSSDTHIKGKIFVSPLRLLEEQSLIFGKNTNNYEENGTITTRRIKTAFHRARNASRNARPSSCSSNIEDQQLNYTKSSCLSKKKILNTTLEEDIHNNSIFAGKRDSRNISLLITHIKPFGRSKNIRSDIKEDNIINIHAEKKRSLSKNRMPSNWSFRANRISYNKTHNK